MGDYERELICVILGQISENTQDDGDKLLATQYHDSIQIFTDNSTKYDENFVEKLMLNYGELAKLIVKYAVIVENYDFSMHAYFTCQSIITEARSIQIAKTKTIYERDQ